MKTYFFIVGILAFLVVVQCEIPPEIKTQLDECLKEFDLPKESIKSPDFENPKMRCFSACVMKKGNRLTGGKVSVDKEMDVARMFMPEKVDDSLKETFTECVNKANEEKDDCAVAGSLFKCIFNNYGAMEQQIEK